MNDLKIHGEGAPVEFMKHFAAFLQGVRLQRGIFPARPAHLTMLKGELRVVGLTVYPSDV